MQLTTAKKSLMADWMIGRHLKYDQLEEVDYGDFYQRFYVENGCLGKGNRGIEACSQIFDQYRGVVLKEAAGLKGKKLTNETKKDTLKKLVYQALDLSILE